MNQEDKREAVGMAVTLSTGLMSAAVGVIAIEIAFSTFIFQQNVVNPLFYVLLIFSIVSLVFSCYFAGRGIDETRKSGFWGNWTLVAGKKYFGKQAALLGLGLILLLPLIFMDKHEQQQVDLKKINNQLSNQTMLLDSLLKGPIYSDRAISTQSSKAIFKLSDWFYAISISVLVLGFILAMVPAGGPRSSNVVALGRILFSVGGLSLIGKVGFDLGGFQFQYNASPNPHISPNQIAFEHVYTVKPFKEASEKLINQYSMDSLVAALGEKLKSRTLVSLFIIGRADKRNLRPLPASIYGSNENLAKARALFVEEQLLLNKNLNLTSNQMTILTSGANIVGRHVSPYVLDSDRCVDVFAYWSTF